MDEANGGGRSASDGELFRLLAENVLEHAIFVTDPEGLVRSWTRGAERLLGYGEGEILGRPASVFSTPEDGRVDAPGSEMRRALETGRAEDDRWYVRRDGSLFWANGVVTPLRDGGGALRGFAKILRDRTEWRRAEQERRGVEAQRAAILEASLDCIITIDDRGNIVEFNPAAERTFGYARSDVLGREMAGLLIPRSMREGHRAGLARYQATGEGPLLNRRVEVTAIRADGSEFPVELAITPTSTGGPTSFTAYLRDLTERKNQERELAERRRLAEFGRSIGLALNERVPLGEMLARTAEETVRHLGGALARVWTVDEAGDILELRASAGIHTHLDGPHARVPIGHYKIGRIALERRPHLTNSVLGDPLVPDQDWARREGLVAFAGYPLVVEDRLVGVWAMFSRRPLSEAALAAMASVADGIAGGIERKKAEEWLREQREWLHVTLASIGDAVISTDEEGRVKFMNPVAEGLTGWSQAEAVGRPIQEVFRILNEQTRRPAESPVGRVLREGVVVGLANHSVVVARDGTETPIEDSAAPIRDASGNVSGVVMVFQDAAERRRHEAERERLLAEALEANRAKTQFLAVLSHELRTPLNPILLATTAMLEGPTGPEDLRPTLEMIRQNVNLQARLIDDLLDVMRIVRGKMPLHWEAADCHRIIDQAVRVCQSEVFGKAIRLTLDLAAPHHHVNADPARLQQVFWNLIKNAVKFSPGGGTLAIRTRNEGAEGGEQLIIEVADTGIGIEPGVLPLIFDPFQQGETRITRKFGGLGLGLAICRGIVDSHGGLLTAESEGLDRGTTFRVTLKTIPSPASIADESAGDPEGTAPATPPRLKILVVEDEPATLRLMARLLRELGHEVTTADTIAGALEAERAGDFTLIISDVGLPDGSGLDLMRQITARRGPVPAIALTGYGMEDDIRRSRAAGFTTHMTKPIDFAKLGAMIHQVAR